MYEENPIFKQPDNENILVWRYMDFTKFVSFIESKQLYFARADKFEDPFEGSWPKLNVDARQYYYDLSLEERKNYIKTMGQISKNHPQHIFINCWHINEHESAAMWKLYLKSDEGIVIQSTYQKLRESFTDNEIINLGIVKYIDYEKERINDDDMLSSFVHKRKSFEHEREVRALINKWSDHGEKGPDYDIETIAHGIPIAVDIKMLIEKIYLAPNTPDWFSDLVKEIVSRYEYTFEVVHSKLDERPFF
jgi:hypothetical protein